MRGAGPAHHTSFGPGDSKFPAESSPRALRSELLEFSIDDFVRYHHLLPELCGGTKLWSWRRGPRSVVVVGIKRRAG
jgi:hypothetical protein